MDGEGSSRRPWHDPAASEHGSPHSQPRSPLFTPPPRFSLSPAGLNSQSLPSSASRPPTQLNAPPVPSSLSLTASKSPGPIPRPLTDGSKNGDPGPSAQVSASPSRPPSSHYEDAQSGGAPTDYSYEGEDGMEEQDHDYERQRRLNISMNEDLLAELGLQQASQQLFPAQSPPPAKSAPRQRGRRVIFDRRGNVLSLPPPGHRQRAKCVEIVIGRKMRRMIDDGEYLDRSLMQGEERRWRFGHGEGGELAEGEEAEVGGVTSAFRFRAWKDKMEAEQKRLQRIAARADAKAQAEAALHGPIYLPTSRESFGPKVPYSELPGVTCHQCRRKSFKPKMQCRNTEPECLRSYCSTCCTRYNYFEFDEESRSFICPYCKGICNCSQCLDKRGLRHLVGSAFSRDLRQDAFRQNKTVQDQVDQLAKNEPDFDCVRLVKKAEDVESLPLPEDWIEWLEKRKLAETRTIQRPLKGRKPGVPNKRRSLGVDGKPVKKRQKKVPAEGEESRPMNGTEDAAALAQREKLVDSDGDTVAGYSSEDGAESRDPGAPPPSGPWESERQRRSTSGISSLNSGVPPIVQYPTTASINDFLARMVPTSPVADTVVEQLAEPAEPAPVTISNVATLQEEQQPLDFDPAAPLTDFSTHPPLDELEGRHDSSASLSEGTPDGSPHRTLSKPPLMRQFVKNWGRDAVLAPAPSQRALVESAMDRTPPTRTPSSASIAVQRRDDPRATPFPNPLGESARNSGRDIPQPERPIIPSQDRSPSRAMSGLQEQPFSNMSPLQGYRPPFETEVTTATYRDSRVVTTTRTAEISYTYTPEPEERRGWISQSQQQQPPQLPQQHSLHTHQQQQSQQQQIPNPVYSTYQPLSAYATQDRLPTYPSDERGAERYDQRVQERLRERYPQYQTAQLSQRGFPNQSGYSGSATGSLSSSGRFESPAPPPPYGSFSQQVAAYEEARASTSPVKRQKAFIHDNSAGGYERQSLPTATQQQSAAAQVFGFGQERRQWRDQYESSQPGQGGTQGGGQQQGGQQQQQQPQYGWQ